MINELMKVAKVLEGKGVINFGNDDNLVGLPKNQAYRVWLLDDGHISRIDSILDDEKKKLKFYDKDNHNRFPMVKLVPNKKGAEDKLKKFQKTSLKLTKELGFKEEETLGILANAIAKIKPEIFLSEFLGKTENAKAEECSLFFDVENYHDYPMGNSKTFKRLNDLVCQANVCASTKELDAYGNDSAGSKENHKPLKIGPWGRVKLYSANEDVPELTKYGCKSIGNFIIGKKSRLIAENVLKWLTKDDNEKNTRRGKTFDFFGKELLIAYPENIEMSDLGFVASFYGENEIMKGKVEENFEERTKKIFEAIKGFSHDAKNDKIQTFVVSNSSQGGILMVNYSKTASVKELEEKAKEWEKGIQNLPKLNLYRWDKQLGKSVLVEKFSVFPMSFSKLANRCFNSSGESKKSLEHFKPFEGLKLFFANQNDKDVKNMFIGFFGNMKGLLGRLCLQCASKERDFKAIEAGVEILPLLGIFLSKLGERKDDYMSESAFLLGKFLRRADELHRIYCTQVRDDEHPNGYCGGRALVAMQGNPQRAMASLVQRLSPYVNWARSYHGENKGLAHWALKNFEDVSNQLHERGIPDKLNDVEKAEMFLGYLAFLDKKEEEKENENV